MSFVLLRNGDRCVYICILTHLLRNYKLENCESEEYIEIKMIIRMWIRTVYVFRLFLSYVIHA